MKLFEKPSGHRYWFSVLVTIWVVQGGTAMGMEPEVSEPTGMPTGLLGDWCRVKKRRITHYTVKEGVLHIRMGRSGHLFEADLTCNDAYTVCKAKTIRGWGTPVSEILRLDGENMNLTRIWGGAWNDKTYNFAFTRCPKW